MERILRVGVIGAGFGAAVHVPALRGIPGVDVLALVDADLPRATEAAKRLGVGQAFDGIDPLLALRPDAVCLAVPPDQNQALAADLIARRIPVFSEKPLGCSGAAAARLAAAAEGIPTAVDFEFGELLTFRALKDLVDTRRFGAVRHVEVSWLMRSAVHRERRAGWKTDSARGGGVVALLGSHVLYLAEWLFGPIVGVFASIDRRATAAWAPPSHTTAEDAAHLALRHAGGVTTALTLDNAGVGGPRHRWEVVFESATATALNLSLDPVTGFRATLSEADAEPRLLAEEPEGENGNVLAVRALLARFLQAVRDGGRSVPDFGSGARVQWLMEAVQASARAGQAVEVAR